METTIYLVRHAHSTYTPDELHRPLSKKGLHDARDVTKVLQREAIDEVYASPYMRARQTVEGIANYIGRELIIERDFKERVLANSPVEDFESAVMKLWMEPNFQWNGGESNQTAQQRGVKAVLRILRNHPGKNIVIGTHGNLMVLIMNYFDQRYNVEFWKKLEMPDIYCLTFNGKVLRKVKRL